MSDFCIGHSGVRSGEYLMGIGSQSKDVMIQVRFPGENSMFPVCSSFFKASDPKMRDMFIMARDLLNWGFFASMSVEERIKWIQSNSTDSDVYLSDVPCELRFISLGNSEFSQGDKISEENRQLLMSGEWVPMSDVYAMFPAASGRGKRHSLIFRPSNWVLVDPNASVEYSGYLNLLTGQYSLEKPLGLECYKAEINFVFDKKMASSRRRAYIGICDEKPDRNLSHFVNPLVKEQVHWFTPAVFKSLIQKCIRVRPEEVQFLSGQLLAVEDVLISAFILLVTHPGGFVPNLNTFVKGAESAFKRLGVSLIEDSICSLEALNCLFGAALAVRCGGYVPSLAFVQRCIQWALAGLQKNYYQYATKNIISEVAYKNLSTEAKVCCDLIGSLGSFETDINMIHDVLVHNRVILGPPARPPFMHIYHCLDQHSIPDIVHFYVGPVQGSSAIVQLIWKEGTGINSRKVPFRVNPDVESAQRLLWIAKSPVIKAERKLSSDFYQASLDIDSSWIAGLIGPMPLKIGAAELLTFFDPENIDKVISIRRPSRDGELVLSNELRNQAASQVQKERYSSPLRVQSSLLGVDMNVYYRQGDFECHFANGEVSSWNEFCKSQFRLPYLEEEEVDSNDFSAIVQMAYAYSSEKGIMKGALLAIESYIQRHNLHFLMRLGMYLRSIKSIVSVYKVNRDGSGTYLMGDVNDSAIFRFFLYLSVIIPGVIEATSNLQFRIKFFPFWQKVRQIVFDMIEKVQFKSWSCVPQNKRILWENQKEAVNSILDRIASGKRGNMLWMDVGLGKTLIVLSIIEELIKEQRMPRFCVFAITPSSEENIVQQIKLMGLSVNRLDGRVLKKDFINGNLRENCVNLVYHDHLDNLHQKLKAVSSESFYLFDEVHFMFSNSKRTSVALELAKTCNLFIAMTGTLIKNKDIVKDNIIEWLGQVVDFEVTSSNYMIGVASLISGKKSLPILVTREEIEVPLLDNSYYDFVDSRFGGNSGHVNYYEAAKICFESIYHGIIQRVQYHKQLGHGCIFIVAKDKHMQSRLHNQLSSLGFKCFSIASGNSISITSASNPQGYDIVIATIRFDTGYDVTAAKYMITAPYPSNEATRTQLVGRIVRLSQAAPEVFVETLHCGILSYTLNHHEAARAIARSLSGLQKEM